MKNLRCSEVFCLVFNEEEARRFIKQGCVTPLVEVRRRRGRGKKEAVLVAVREVAGRPGVRPTDPDALVVVRRLL